MPMGISGAPMTFSKIVSQILGDFVAVYIDDKCIFSESAKEHETSQNSNG